MSCHVGHLYPSSHFLFHGLSWPHHYPSLGFLAIHVWQRPGPDHVATLRRFRGDTTGDDNRVGNDHRVHKKPSGYAIPQDYRPLAIALYGNPDARAHVRGKNRNCVLLAAQVVPLPVFVLWFVFWGNFFYTIPALSFFSALWSRMADLLTQASLLPER